MFPRLALFLAIVAGARGAVTAVHLKERTDVLGGISLGKGGAYERIIATVRFALDPDLPANRVVRDLQYAKRNAQGLVEFSADLYVLRPRDYHRTNGTVLLEVPNRGNKTIFDSLFLARRTQDPRTEEEFGNRWLLEEGYALAWIGWQQDVASGLLRLEGPSTAGISGLARHEFIGGPTPSPLPFVATDPATKDNVLTVRETATGNRSIVPREHWRFGDGGRSLTLDGGFRPHAIYELIYVVKDPPVTGLGLAAVRDMAAYFKYPQPLNQLLADQSLTTKRVVGYGLSQSARFLRQFLYDGFNADEQGRQVFDGLIVDAGGAGRGSFNHRFAAAGRQGSSVNEHFWPVDIFPFTDQPETDPETGRTGGLLVRAEQQHVTPKLMLINSSVEYWARAASLLTTSIDGHDIAPGTSTRIYFIAGTTHSGAEFPPQARDLRYLNNFATKYLAVRALFAAMQAWLAEGRDPPPSVYPGRAELALPEQLHPPAISGVTWPTAIPAIYRLDFGPAFETDGIIEHQPPVLGKAYALLVPRVDADGNDIGGLRLPEVAVSLGTHTGWNYVEPAPAQLNPLAGLAGSFLPFARTKEERERKHDPRASIDERYPTREDYLRRVQAEANRLVAAGYLLQRDVPVCLRQAEREWEYVTGQK